MLGIVLDGLMLPDAGIVLDGVAVVGVVVDGLCGIVEPLGIVELPELVPPGIVPPFVVSVPEHAA